LGSIEVEDYLKVLAHLKSDLPFVDPKRTAIWGSSYGGFISAAVLAHERNTFNCAIAVAPITNWLFVGESSYEFLSSISAVLSA
jgi:dipeptidyl-peptidase-4